MSILSLLVPAALAASPVISSGEDPRVVLTRAAAASKRPAEELRVVTFPELAAVHPAVVEGGGLVEECRGQPTTMGTVREALDRAEKALAYLEFDKAQAHLALGHGQLRCLSEPADARDAAKMYFLTGFVAASQQRLGEAEVAFGRVLAFNPGFTWDDTYPPDGKEILDGLRALGSAGQTELMVLPATGRSDLWVDGKKASLNESGSVSLPLGPHLVQVTTDQITSFWVNLRDESPAEATPAEQTPEPDAAAPDAAAADAEAEAPSEDAVADGGEAKADRSAKADKAAKADRSAKADKAAEEEAAESEEEAYPVSGPVFGGAPAGGVPSARMQQLRTQHVLVAPSLVPVSAAAWAADPTQRDELTLILASMLDPDTVVYFSSSGEVYAHTVGAPAWESLRVPTNLARAGGPAGRHAAGRAVFWSGAVTTTGGLGIVGVGWLQAKGSVNRAKSTDAFPVYDLARTDHGRAANLMTVGRWVTLSGVVLTAGGLGLQYDNLPGIFGKRSKATAMLTPTWSPDHFGVGLTLAQTR